ncbi:hypothetical protein RND81_02G146700 [Saponaria officinalis]|uniref:Pentatricopeptide repeat-containing protein n=1 Tax=Saponaria officinalis TaxID=3572 RepID=A0AAW1MUA6_SAPOF
MGCVSLPKCFILQTPGFGVVANTRKKKQQGWISVSSRPSYVTSSLSVSQTDSNSLQKEETEFKSSFDEYLKAMESIRADREQKKGQEEGGGDRKKVKEVAFTKKEPKDSRRNEFRMLKRSNGSKFDEKDGLYERSRVVANKARLADSVRERFVKSSPKELNYTRSNDDSRKNSYVDTTAVSKDKGVWKKSMPVDEMTRDIDLETERVALSLPKKLNYTRSNDDARKNSYLDTTAVSSNKRVWKKSIPVDEMTSDIDLETERVSLSSRKELNYTRSKDDARKNSYADPAAVSSSKRVWKKSMPVDEMTRDTDLEMERFLFQSSELQNDVPDGLRVSRMEMEERIQKLAKRLNEADTDIPEWMFSKTMRSARIRFSDHSFMRIIQILGKLGNWRMVLQVVEWLQMRERFKSHKIRYVYTAALGGLGKARRPLEALNLFVTMQRSRSSYPDIVAYHTIAVTLGQAGYMRELFDVIDSMRLMPTNFKIEGFEDWDPRLEPDIVVYNAVLNACVTRKEWEGAFWIMQKLAETDQQPSSTTYGLLMEVMLSCGKYDLVHEYFRQMQASSAPNALTYRVLVKTLWKEGKTEEAVAAVQEMECRGLVGSASLYYDLARCLCSAGRCEEALMQVDKICRVASKPLVVTYTGLMQACLDSGNVDGGTFIFNHMQKYCSPNLVTCNIMLKAYLRHGVFTEANELFQKMTESEQQGSKASGRVTADIHTFSLMLEACVNENRWDDFHFAYDQMLQHGHPFNTKRHLWMVLRASEAGKVEVVETTWRHLMQSGRVPPPAIVKERFRLKMEDDDLVAAISSVASHPSSHQQSFSKEAWSKLLDDNAHRFNKDAIQHLIRNINYSLANTELPNLIYQNLRDSCAEYVGLNEPVTGKTLITETHVIN